MSKVLFLFPGQGSQKVGMGKDLYENFKVVQASFEEASDTLHLNMKKLCFEGPEEELKKTFHTQPALLTVSVSTLRVLETESSLKPDLVAGHSLGEYSALVAGHALSFKTALSLVKARGTYMQEAAPQGVGAMSAILGLDSELVSKCCSEISSESSVVNPANFNAPGQVVISGHKEAVEKASALCKEKGAKRAIPLPVSAPFHCSLMKSAAEKMKDDLEKIQVSDLSVPYIANFDAKVHKDAGDVKELLVSQICGAVRWVESMEKAFEQGVSQAFEIGSGQVLTGLMKKIDREFPMHSISNIESIKKWI